MGWFSSLFSSAPSEPRQVKVGLSKVKITLDDKEEINFELEGEYWGKHPFASRYDNSDWIKRSNEFFYDWQERCGKTGLAYVMNGRYVPLGRIKEITHEYDEDHTIEVP